MGAFLLLKDVFQGMRLLGIDRFFYGGLFLNLLSIFFAMTGVYTLAKRLFDVKTALLAVFAFAIWSPLYFWVAVFYTDMLTLGFLPWVLVFIVKAKDALETRQYKAAAVHLAAAALAAEMPMYTILSRRAPKRPALPCGLVQAMANTILCTSISAKDGWW